MVRKIKLMAEYYGCVLWEAGGHRVGDIEPETLPISEGLVRDLRAWADAYDSILNQDCPQDSGFNTPEEEAAFDAEGRRLWAELRSQLGADYQVVYFSNVDLKTYE